MREDFSPESILNLVVSVIHECILYTNLVVLTESKLFFDTLKIHAR